MGLFDNLFKKADTAITIGAPAAGKYVPLKDVSDPTFAEGILGNGAAVKPTDGKIVSPADGVIGSIFPTGHAFTLTTKDGAELLVHIGIDTVKLNGKNFTVHAQENQNVKKGDLIIEADIAQLEADGYDTVIPVIVCNTADFKSVEELSGDVVNAGDAIIKIEKN